MRQSVGFIKSAEWVVGPSVGPSGIRVVHIYTSDTSISQFGAATKKSIRNGFAPTTDVKRMIIHPTPGGRRQQLASRILNYQIGC